MLPSSLPNLPDVHSLALEALMASDPLDKCERTTTLAQQWEAGGLTRETRRERLPRTATPGRPPRPVLVPPRDVPRRSPHTREGHAALVHAIAHIEFNAINLALDCVARFTDMPDGFVGDWLRVAREEAHHFSLLRGRLSELGYAYGDFPGHDGLWEMAVKTDHDVLARMALVPRVLEARGLDATPPIAAKLREAGDLATVAILEVVLRDEIGHVATGDRWFRHLCAERGLHAENEYARWVRDLGPRAPKPPFNRAARLEAGFTEAELDALEAAAVAPREAGRR